VLATKAAVFGAASLAVGEAAAFLAFFAGGAAFRHGVSAPALSQPGVLRAILLGGASYCLIGLVGLGLGAIIRHTAAAIAVLVAGVFLIGLIIGAAARAVAAYLPIFIIGNSLTTTKPQSCAGAAQCVHFLSPWAGLAVLSLYAAAALAIGGWLLVRRDA
jgi:ABC-2 type transport system permease protein